MRSTESAGFAEIGNEAQGSDLFDRQRRPPAEPVVEQADPAIHASAHSTSKPQLTRRRVTHSSDGRSSSKPGNFRVSDRYPDARAVCRGFWVHVCPDEHLAGSRDAPVKRLFPSYVSWRGRSAAPPFRSPRGRHGRQPSDEAIASASVDEGSHAARQQEQVADPRFDVPVGCPGPNRPSCRPRPHRGRRCAAEHIDECSTEFVPAPSLNTHHAAPAFSHSG